jgi:hypothetical protein
VAGAYTLRITPSASCAMDRTPLSFPMTAAPTAPTTHPGAQVLLDPNGYQMELEVIEENFTIRGGLGTYPGGVPSDQGVWVWVRAIAAGSVQRSANGNGEVVTGTLAGYLALAGLGEFEGARGTCNAADHAFTLRTR